MGISTLTSPGENMDQAHKTALGKLLLENTDTNVLLANTSFEEVYLHSNNTYLEKDKFIDFIVNIFPSNIFSSLVEGNSLQVLFFSIILGLALGMLHTSKSEAAVDFFDSIYDAFSKVVTGLMYILPFGLMALIAKHVSHIGAEFLYAVIELMVVILGTSIIMILVGLIIGHL